MKIYVVMHKDEPLYVSKYQMFADTWAESKFPQEIDQNEVYVLEFENTPSDSI
jgi:hypothetical protein